MLERLRHLRNDWSGEIPDKVVHLGAHKARRSWFQAIVAELKVGIQEGEITDPAKIRAAEEFMGRYTAPEFLNQKLTERGDIEAGDRIINVILSK